MCIATDVVGWRLAEVMLYQGIPFEITQGISDFLGTVQGWQYTEECCMRV
jgi:hypothetical protein